MSDDKYIAMDVLQAATVVSVMNATGRDLDMAILPTQPLIRYLESLRGRLHLTFEEGAYSAWLYDLLQGRVAELVVCDPRRNALLTEGNRTDHHDAHKLALSVAAKKGSTMAVERGPVSGLRCELL